TLNELSLEEIGRLSSYFFHYNDIEFNMRYLNERGCRWFGMSMEQIVEMKEEFVQKFYHPDTIEFEFPKIKRFYDNYDCDTVYSDYHQIFNPSLQVFSICLVFIKKCTC